LLINLFDVGLRCKKQKTMGYLFNPTAKLIEATFPLMPALGNGMNYALMAVGAVACTIWIGLMLKYEKQEVPNRQ
jgi:hypothetical protein